MSTTSKLAIILPAYKPTFLKESLSALFSQNNKNFNVYIGTENQDPAILDICQPFLNKTPKVTFHCFEDPLGQAHLVAQWARCIRLAKDEPWLWLFSDDDLISENCVAAFYETLNKTEGKYDLYRFDKIEIDAGGHPTEVSPPHPLHESSLEFCYHLLQGQRECTAVEYIFSRAIYEKHDGFVPFRYAWGSDWCSWMLFGEEKGIRLIPEGTVYFRSSTLNISSDLSLSEGKILATFEYTAWMNSFFSGKQHILKPISGESIKKLTEFHFLTSLQNYPWRILLKKSMQTARRAKRQWGRPVSFYLFRIFRVIIRKITTATFRLLSFT